jgi:hypothetical protein
MKEIGNCISNYTVQIEAYIILHHLLVFIITCGHIVIGTWNVMSIGFIHHTSNRVLFIFYTSYAYEAHTNNMVQPILRLQPQVRTANNDLNRADILVLLSTKEGGQRGKWVGKLILKFQNADLSNAQK